MPTMPRHRPFVAAFLAIVCLSLVWFVVGCDSAGAGRSGSGAQHPSVGTPLETLKLQPLTGDGPALTTSDLDGKVTLINYWGPWCGYCKVEFPHLVDLEKHFREREDFQFVSVSCSGDFGPDTEMAESTAEFLKSHQANFPTYRDAGMASRDHLAKAANLGGFGYPVTVIVGPDRTIRGLWMGYLRGDEKEMRRVVQSTLDEKA
jgi:thiol-disulfide isomerase/thioredoxin